MCVRMAGILPVLDGPSTLCRAILCNCRYVDRNPQWMEAQNILFLIIKKNVSNMLMELQR
jgi:hypothetical protein